MNGLLSPHRLLSEYIKQHITCDPDDIGQPFYENELAPQVKVDMTSFDWNRLMSGKLVLQASGCQALFPPLM